MYYNVSSEFKTAINESSRTFKAKMEFPIFGTLSAFSLSDEVVDISIEQQSSDSDKVSIGSTMCAQCSATVYNIDGIDLKGKSIQGREFSLSIGLVISDDNIEWIPMGVYVIKDVEVTNNFEYKLTAYDKMLNADKQYLTELIYPNTATNALNDICSKTGILPPTKLYDDIVLRYLPKGITMREMISYIASMLGCFAVIDRKGRITFRWYTNTYSSYIELDRDAIDEPTASSTGYTIQYIECTVRNKTLISGDKNGTMGLSFENPFMTQELLDSIFVDIGGFSYYAVEVNQILGNPCNDVWDIRKVIISESDTSDTGYDAMFPCMNITFEFDGGLSCKMSSSIPTDDDDYQTPYEREQDRVNESVEESTIVAYGINSNPVAVTGRGSFTEIASCNISVYSDALPYAIATVPYSMTTTLSSVDVTVSLQVDKKNYWTFIKSVNNGYGIFNISAPLINLSANSHSVGIALSFSDTTGSTLSVEQGNANIIVTGNGLSGTAAWDGLITAYDECSAILVNGDSSVNISRYSEAQTLGMIPVLGITHTAAVKAINVSKDTDIQIQPIAESGGMGYDIVSAIIKDATTLEITFTNPIQAVDLSKISVSSVLDSSCVFTVDVDPEKSYALDTVLTIVATSETCDFTTDTYILVSVPDGALSETLTGQPLIFDKVINGGSNQ